MGALMAGLSAGISAGKQANTFFQDLVDTKEIKQTTNTALATGILSGTKGAIEAPKATEASKYLTMSPTKRADLSAFTGFIKSQAKKIPLGPIGNVFDYFKEPETSTLPASLLKGYAAGKPQIESTFQAMPEEGLLSFDEMMENPKRAKELYKRKIGLNPTPEQIETLGYIGSLQWTADVKKAKEETQKEENKQKAENFDNWYRNKVYNGELKPYDFENNPAQIFDKYKSEQDKYDFLVQTDRTFIQDLKELGFYDEEAEKREVATAIPTQFIKGTFSGLTMGISDKLLETLNSSPYEGMPEYILETANIVGQVANIAGMFAGGAKTYGAIANKLDMVFRKVPKLATFANKYNYLYGVTIRNTAEEIVEMGVRKGTGQKYGFKDFAFGISFGVGFESFGALKNLYGKNKAVASHLSRNADTVNDLIQTRIINETNIKERELTSNEIRKIIFDTPIGEGFTGKDIFGLGQEIRLKSQTLPVFRDPSKFAQFTPYLKRKPELREGIEIAKQPEIDPLIQEARKYSSAEEFVKDNVIIEPKMYKGKNTGGIIKYKDGELKYSIEDGAMVIDNVSVQTQKKGTGTILMRTADDVATTLNVDRIELGAFPQDKTITSENLVKFYENLGYDINSDMPFNGGTYFDMSKNVGGQKIEFKTKSQLTDIWQKANGSKVDPLIQEARKYSSAEEFVNTQGDNGNAIVKVDRYAESRGDDGVFHDAFRIFDKKTGQKLDTRFYTTKGSAQEMADKLNKSQLTDIWQKANAKETPILPKMPEYKMGKEGREGIERKGKELYDVINTEIKNRTSEKGIFETQKTESKVAMSVRAKAIEKDLYETFSEVAGYNKITVPDQIRQAIDLFNNDYKYARAVINGEAPVPNGLRDSTMIKVAEDFADVKNDVGLQMDIMKSPLVSETSIHAQEMRMLAERNPDSATAKLKEIEKARKEKFERLNKGKTVKKAVSDEVKALQKAKKSVKSTKETWDDFVDSITC